MGADYQPTDLGADIGTIVNELRKALVAYQGSAYRLLGDIHRMDITLKAFVSKEASGGVKVKIPSRTGP